MTWTNLNESYNNSPTGILDQANSSTDGYYGGVIVAIVWLVVVFATHDRYPKFSLAAAGFFAFFAAVMLKLILTTFSDIFLLAALGSAILPILIIAFSGRGG